MKFINDNENIKKYCSLENSSEFITIDLEFIRRNTYFAIPCLIQIGGEHNAFCIDLKEEDLDFSPLYTLLKNPKILKVFHAARQDLEIIYNLIGELPSSVFDTQIAAQVLGFGESVSYQKLVESFVGINLDKTARFTNWCNRPLSPEQIDYALSDVTHLREVYIKINKALIEKNRYEWLKEELSSLCDEEKYKINPKDAWQKLKIKNKTPLFLSILRELASLREEKAVELDLPRGYILKDEAIYEIASSMPKSEGDLTKLNNYNSGLKKISKDILSAVQRGMNTPKEEMPQIEAEIELGNGEKTIYELLKAVLNVTASKAEVTPNILATSQDLKILALNNNADIPALNGWRYEVFGKVALDIKSGKAGITFNPQTKVIEIFNIS